MEYLQSVSPQEAYTRTNNRIALLICAYDSDNKFENVHLEGAIALSTFKAMLNTISNDKELIFY